MPATNTMWAEDGTIFYSQALAHSFGETVTTVYNGYFQLFPRLFVQVTHLFPVRDAAAVISILGAMSVAAVALLVFHAARGHISSPAARSVLVGAMVLLPIANSELLDNLVNVPWWFFFATFWLLLWRPQKWAGLILAAAVCLLATGSDPAVGLFLPLAIVRILVVKGVRENAAVIGFAAGLLYQVFAILDAGVQSTAAHASFQGVPSLFALRVGLGSFTGTRWTNLIVASHEGVWLGVGALVPVVVLVVAFVRRSPAEVLFVCSALFFTLFIFAGLVWIRGAAPLMTNATAQVGSRYVAVPMLLLLSALIAEADRFQLKIRGMRANVGIVFCCLLLVPSWIVDLRTPNDRSPGPSWSRQVSVATAACRRDPKITERLLRSTYPGWYAGVPCSDLR
jgi:hypothetical protein